MTHLPPEVKKQGPDYLRGYCLGGARSESSEVWSCEEFAGANSVRKGCGSLPAGAMPAGSGFAIFETMEVTVSAGQHFPQFTMFMPCMLSRGGMLIPWHCS